MYACVYSPGYDDQRRAAEHAECSPGKDLCGLGGSALIVVAQQFSPRYETHRDLVVIDVRGLDRLFGHARLIGDELRREAADRGLRVHVAIASTQTAATILAIARPGVVVVEPGDEAAAVAQVPIDLLENVHCDDQREDGKDRVSAIAVFKRWGLRSFGDLAALPADELSARLGQQGLAWHTIARGADVRPLVPDVEAERFEASLDLEWPIEGLEPLSFVLTRLLEPLSLRLEQRDRGVAVLHVQLRLVTKEMYARRLELPTPMRDVKTLRTLALLDLEAQSLFTPGTPASRTATVSEQVGIDRVAIVIDPTPGRVWQHTLFTRPHPTPEQLSTLLARLGAAMGQDRIGAPVLVDSYRPGAFEMKPFAVEHTAGRTGRMGGTGRMDSVGGTGRMGGTRRMVEDTEAARSHQPVGPAPPLSRARSADPAHPARPAMPVALRRCRQPVPARVVAHVDGRPMKVTTDRRGFAGGAVLHATGPWKTSGEWWLGDAAGQAGGAGQTGRAGQARRAGGAGRAGRAGWAGWAGWDRDEWDVALSDGASYRVFLDHSSGRWFIDAILD